MTPTISIAICTRNHPDELVECLRSLAQVRDKALEVIVIDNASDGDATRKVAQAFGAKYVNEPSIGLVHARNRAIVTAVGDIIAFTDDDCQAGAGWLDAIGRAFSDPTVGAVTGQAVSGRDANWVQRQFDSFAVSRSSPTSIQASSPNHRLSV
jgi:glycosyltransferase involved in cell wall biosynthesis